MYVQRYHAQTRHHVKFSGARQLAFKEVPFRFNADDTVRFIPYLTSLVLLSAIYYYSYQDEYLFYGIWI